MQASSLYTLAAAYGSNAYGTNVYNAQGSTSASTSTGTSSGGSGVLTNTGESLLLGFTLGCTIIFIALLARFWRRPKKSTPPIA